MTAITYTEGITPGGDHEVRAIDCDGREWSAILIRGKIHMAVLPTAAERRRRDWETRTVPLAYEGDDLWANFRDATYETHEEGVAKGIELLTIACNHVAALAGAK